MINSKLEEEECSQEKLNQLLAPADVEDDYPRMMVEPRISRNAQFKNLNSFPQGSGGEVKYKKGYSDKISSLRLISKKKFTGLEIQGTSGVGIVEPKYDAIYAFANEDLKIGHTYFLIEKDNKFGVYGLAEKRVVVPVEYNSITKGRYDDILMVYEKDRVGVCLLGDVFHDASTYFFGLNLMSFYIETMHDPMISNTTLIMSISSKRMEFSTQLLNMV